MFCFSVMSSWHVLRHFVNVRVFSKWHLNPTSLGDYEQKNEGTFWMKRWMDISWNCVHKDSNFRDFQFISDYSSSSTVNILIRRQSCSKLIQRLKKKKNNLGFSSIVIHCGKIESQLIAWHILNIQRDQPQKAVKKLERTRNLSACSWQSISLKLWISITWIVQKCH